MNMSVSSLRALLAAALFLSAVVGGATSPRMDGRSDASGEDHSEQALVGVFLNASDGSSQAISTLKSEDIRLIADGTPQQVLTFTHERVESVRLAIVLDASASQEKALPSAKAAALELISSSLRPGKDSAAVVSFTNNPRVVQELTGDVAALRRAIESVQFIPPLGYVGGGIIVGTPPPAKSMPGSTALWDALAYVSEDVLSRSNGGRRAIILISDGIDTSSKLKSDKAIEKANRAGVTIYGVGVGGVGPEAGLEKGNLRKASEQTGGRALFPEHAKDLPAAFGRLWQELTSSYHVTFAPTTSLGGDSTHKLHIEVVNPELRKQGVKLAYRKSFFIGEPAAKK